MGLLVIIQAVLGAVTETATGMMPVAGGLAHIVVPFGLTWLVAVSFGRRREEPRIDA